jgi:hypothetical protein
VQDLFLVAGRIDRESAADQSQGSFFHPLQIEKAFGMQME